MKTMSATDFATLKIGDSVAPGYVEFVGVRNGKAFGRTRGLCAADCVAVTK